MSSRGIRNNNPGNIDYNKRQFGLDPWVGENGPETRPNGSEGRFTTFTSPVFGIRALCKILLTYYRLRKAEDGSEIDTVKEVIDRWAPPSENDSASYARVVRLALGVRPGQFVNLEDPETLMTMATAIIKHENGEQPYDEATIAEGARLALA
jgi:hypothetical protein|tara:strand:+ start:5487 stop:5942 length:456 start_codon:yes stop_codon:yes gene_type:complete